MLHVSSKVNVYVPKYFAARGFEGTIEGATSSQPFIRMQMQYKIIFFLDRSANPIRTIFTSVLSDYDLKRWRNVTKSFGSPFNRALYAPRFIISRQDNRNLYYFNASLLYKKCMRN
jgi:hypothetical protein